MTITHHLDDATLMSCAAGSQPEAIAAVVASHLSLCPRCRAEITRLERIGATLFDALPGERVTREAPVVALRAGEACSPPPEADASAAPSGEPDGDVPAPIRGLVGRSLKDIRWRWLAPGVWDHPLPLSSGARGDLRLVKIAPGKTMPEHGHGGTEMTLVLGGSYTDRFGTFHTGDVADLTDEVEHQPVADPKDGCICLIASEGKARFKSLLARLFQPLTGL